MPPINKPPIGLTDKEILCVIATLQSLGGTPTVTLQTTHHYTGSDGRARLGPRRRRASATPAPRSDAMNLLVVLAVVAAFGAPSLPPGQPAGVGRRLVGRDLRPPPLRIQRRRFPSSVVTLYMGIVVARDPGLRDLQRGAPRGSVRARSSGS